MRAAPAELQQAVNAVRMQMDWRPLMGLTSADEGSLFERVLAGEVLEAAVAAHNADVDKMKK